MKFCNVSEPVTIEERKKSYPSVEPGSNRDQILLYGSETTISCSVLGRQPKNWGRGTFYSRKKKQKEGTKIRQIRQKWQKYIKL